MKCEDCFYFSKGRVGWHDICGADIVEVPVGDRISVCRFFKPKENHIGGEDILTDEEKYRVQALHSKTTWNS